MKFLARMILSFFGTGFVRTAPGTVGSLVAALAIYILQPSIFELSISIRAVVVGIAIVTMFLLGWFLTTQVLTRDFDQSWIVLDEVVGMLLASVPVLFFSENFLRDLIFAFALFRFFDISKLGSRQIDARGTPFSVFADDTAAGIFAAVTLLLIQVLI